VLKRHALGGDAALRLWRRKLKNAAVTVTIAGLNVLVVAPIF
jgi:hypothetical protein